MSAMRTALPIARPRLPTEGILEALLADTENGVLVLDARGRIRAASRAALQMLALDAAAVRGRHARDVLRTPLPDDDPLEELLASGRLERETLLLTPEGVELPVSLRGYRLRRPAWAVLVFRDLTRPRRMQEELRRTERLAILGQLAAGAAHEIRNPLAGIGTSAQVLLRRFEPHDERARFAQVILDEVARLDRIVTSMLQYARPRAPVLKPATLAECVERVRELCDESFTLSSIEVDVSVAPRLGQLWIDRDLVQQVIHNLTRNAVEAMPGGGRLRYEIRRVRRRRPGRGPGRRRSDPARNGSGEGWSEFQQIRVSDTGSGIPRGLMAKLFQPFVTTRPQGTGLGLSICQTIMQEHGGTIEVTSREQRGTTVLLSFPMEKRDGERRDAAADAGRPHAARR
jgi:PAS domain S-box-containing protein